MDTNRPTQRTWAWVVVCVGVCVTVLVAVALHSAGTSITDHKAQPCTLGELPPGASADGGIVAALVDSTYPPPTPFKRGQRPPITITTTSMCILRASDGAQLAHFSLDSTHLTPYQRVPTQVAPDGSAIYLASSNDAHPGPGSGRLCAVHPRSGRVLWCNDLDAFPIGMVLSGRDIFVNTLHSLNAFDAATGKLRWRNAQVLPAFPQYQLRRLGSLLVGVSGDDVAPIDEVCVWRISDGSVAWCTHTYQDVPVQDMAADENYVTMGMSFADNTGLVEQINAETGNVIWTFRLPESRVHLLADANGITYVMPLASCYLVTPTCEHNVAMLRETTGTVVANFSVYGQFNSFTVSDGLAIAATSSPYGIIGSPVPGSPHPLTPFTFHPRGGVPVSIVGTQAHNLLYIGPERAGLFSFANDAPTWEADACGGALAGSALSTLQQGTTIWCHWPPGTTVRQVAIQSQSAGG
ncbi:MAG TPA: PQQ-binding-like beta-propeller repeat protein [Ktedonobacterales bacterium]